MNTPGKLHWGKNVLNNTKTKFETFQNKQSNNHFQEQ